MDINNNEMQNYMVEDPDFASLVDSMPERTADDSSYSEPCYDDCGTDLYSTNDFTENLPADEHTEKTIPKVASETAFCVPVPNVPAHHVWNGPELYHSQGKEFDLFIESMLTNGLTFLNAFSKVGKSRILMQMLLAISSGNPFLGMPTTQCDTLYLPLEDTKQDTVSRLKAFCEDTPPSEKFHVIIGDDQLCKDFGPEITLGDDSTLIAMIESVLVHIPTIRVIGIDVFGSIRSNPKPGENFMMHERRDIGYLIDFANKHDIAVIVAHHVSKSGLNDKSRSNATGSGAGSYVISGTVHAEFCITLDKEDNTKAEFSYKGRRIESGSIMIKSNYPRWDRIGTGSYRDESIRENPIIQTIQFLVSTSGKWHGTSKQFVEAHNKARTDAHLPIFSTAPTKRVFDKLTPMLHQLSITYTYQSNGSGGGVHYFISKNPITQQQITF